ncbi:MAG: HEAT repeat domain-containing protein [Planctomycetes bacterium]|nr:HEAT repeat domain-containing protein [Planctomycetota bacterium]
MWSLRRWTLGGTLVAALAAGVVFAQQPPAESRPAGPPTTQSSFDPQRLNDLIVLIEGQNSPQARRTGARELLRQGWSETVPRLTAILRGSSQPAKVAVALALSDLPKQIASEYVEPLLAMLADPQADVRRAAALALAGSPVDAGLPGLRALVLGNKQPRAARLAAIETLGMMTQREAVAVLIEALADRDEELAGPALEAVERTTAQDFQGDCAAARAWWETARQTTPDQWQRLQIERLVRQDRAQQQRLRDLEQRLAHALRESYVRTPEAQRPALLNAHLTDASAAVRLLGLELVQSLLAEGKTLTPETAAYTRELLTAPEPTVRAAAVRTVATLRDLADAERFQQLLATERHAAVREALVNGLGYVGAASSVVPLLELLESAGHTISSEAVTALGRLAERGVLNGPSRVAVATALLAHVHATPREDYVMRERLLWAMSRVGDPRCGPEFMAALKTPEAATVRLAAVRGIAVLVDPRMAKVNGLASAPAAGENADRLVTTQKLIDALVPVTSDPDAGVRRAAVEVLAQFATSDTHAEALWTRLSSEREPEEAIRVTAWRGVTRVVASRPVDEIELWLDRLPGDEATQRQHAVELLQAAEKNLDGKPEVRGELGRTRARLAAERAALGQVEQSISGYLMALQDLHAASSPEFPRAALELLRLALLEDRYDAQLAAVLADENPALDGAALWEGIREEIEQRLHPDEVDRAIAMLVALKTSPPASMPADTQAALEQILQRARQVRAEADTAVVSDALQKLHDNPDDEQALRTVLELGSRATPVVRDALRAALQVEPPDANHVQQLHDLLKALVPDWPGFAPDATSEEKLMALQAIDT